RTSTVASVVPARAVPRPNPVMLRSIGAGEGWVETPNADPRKRSAFGSGERGIRTLGTGITGTRAFQARPFSHSGTSPGRTNKRYEGRKREAVESPQIPASLALRAWPLHGHDVVLLLLQHLVHLRHVLVGQLLELLLGLVAHVLGQVFLVQEPQDVVLRVFPHVADGHLGVLPLRAGLL